MTDPSAQPSYTPQFAPLPQATGVRVIDPVEGVKFDLYTSRAVEPTPTDPEGLPFCYPVESATRISASELETPTRLNVNVRDTDGDLVASATNNGPVSVDECGTYVLELSNTPMKLYVTVTSRILVLPGEATTELVFPDADAFAVGARSFHKQPARTITTTAEPTDLMRAISEFGAALKTTSPERSFPTWRGHPPLLELGDSLDIPGGTRCPDTGVRIEVPPDLSYLYPIVPLAYYLGADVRPGDTPRLLTGDGFEHPLATRPDFETSVARILKQLFTLDCLTRTEGHYDVCLDERERAHARGINLDYATLYDAPLATRVARYLSVPFEDLEPIVPQWRLTADVTPAVKYADLLPYIAAELAVVRCTTTETDPESTVSSRPDELTEFYRSGQDDTGTDSEGESAETGAYLACGSNAQVSADGGTWTETGTDHIADRDTHVRQDDIFRVEDAPTITQTYIGDGFPLGANKGSKTAYERRLSIRSNATSRIDVTVICNDSEMHRETAVGEVYGTRDLFEFDVTVYEELTVADLRDALQADTDFVHYIGHVDARGLQATDGFLDAHTLDTVGARAFFLNACRSFRQGAALVNRGAVAGIATLEDVHNSVATDVGHTIARLLNAGWPLDGALRLVQDDTIAGRHYIVVGDGLVELVTPDSGVPVVAQIESLTGGDTYNVTIETYPTRHRHLLTLFMPYIGDNERRYLASGELDTFTVTSDELREFLSLGSFPIQFDSSPIDNRTLQWSDEVNVDAL